jgi:hypothetical protein
LAALAGLVRSKWIADPNSSEHLPVVQILGPQRVTSGFRSRLHDHGIPKIHLGLFVKRDRGKDIVSGRREHSPGRELADPVDMLQS